MANAMGSPGGLQGPRVVALFGPTGAGKTDVAVELGGLLKEASSGAVAINCDSMQIYSEMPVLTGAPGPHERELLEHRLVGFLPVTSEFSAGAFGDLAKKEIDSVLEEGLWPILVGGTGLYMRAALTDLSLLPPVPDEVLARVEEAIEREGSPGLHRRLPEEVRSWVHPNDRKRVTRYTALIEVGENPRPPTGSGGQLWAAPFRKPTTVIGLVMDRDQLESRVEDRVERMAQSGAIEEARRIRDLGPSRTAAKAMGLDEFADGDLDRARQRHLTLARRQQTWLRKMAGAHLVDRTNLTARETAQRVFNLLASGDGVHART